MLDVVSGSPSRDLYIDYGQTNTSKISARPYVHVKRCIDIIATLVLAPIALAIVGILALLVRRDGGNAFFCQPRVGRNGKVFKLWKLRTMVPDADEVLRAYLERDAGARAEWEKTQKLRTDPGSRRSVVICANILPTRCRSFGMFLSVR